MTRWTAEGDKKQQITIQYLADLLSMGLTERATENSEVLTEHEDLQVKRHVRDKR